MSSPSSLTYVLFPVIVAVIDNQFCTLVILPYFFYDTMHFSWSLKPEDSHCNIISNTEKLEWAQMTNNREMAKWIMRHQLVRILCSQIIMKNDFLRRVEFINHNDYFWGQTEQFILKEICGWITIRYAWISLFILLWLFISCLFPKGIWSGWICWRWPSVNCLIHGLWGQNHLIMRPGNVNSGRSL
jgi:hypothetical protein